MKTEFICNVIITYNFRNTLLFRFLGIYPVLDIHTLETVIIQSKSILLSTKPNILKYNKFHKQFLSDLISGCEKKPYSSH